MSKFKMSLWAVIISFCMSAASFTTTPLINNAYAADTEEDKETNAFVTLGKNVDMQNINRVFMGTSDKVTVSENNGVSGWQIKSSSSASAFLYVDIDDKFGSSIEDGSVFDVEIDYYDREKGYFVVWYDSVDYGAQIAKEVYIDATDQWKTAHFTLDNAGFKNGIDNKADLKISTQETGLKLAKSECDVNISEIRIKKHKAVNPIYVEAYTDQPGNTFEYYKENKTVHNRLINTTDSKTTAKLTYRLVDENGFSTWSDTSDVTLEPGEEKTEDINMLTDRCGIYTYYIDVDVDGKEKSSTFKEDQITIVKTDQDGIKGKFAWTSHHFDRYPDDRVDECIELMKMANIGGTRASFNWSGVEKSSRGNYSVNGARAWDIIKKCTDAGLEVLYQFAFGNSLYTGDTMNMPQTPEEMTAWRNYVSYMTGQLKGICDKYEVWNEPDLVNFNKRGAGPETLAEITTAAAEEIHKIQPEAKVGGLSVTGIKRDDRLDHWMKGTMEAGMADSIDVLTLHGYVDAGTMPEDGLMHERVKDFQNMASEYGVENIPVWITETGYTTADTNTTEKSKADWIARAAILYKAHKTAEISFQYNFEKKGIIDIDREDNFGMVSTPYEKYNIEGKIGIPTQTYASYAGMNYVLGGNVISDGVYDADDNIRINRFKSEKFNKNIIAMWAAHENKQITLKLDTDTVDYYDCYGNKTVINGQNGLFTFLLDQRAAYIVGDFKNQEITDNSDIIEFENTLISAATGDTINIKINNTNNKPYKLDTIVYDSARVEKSGDFIDGVSNTTVFVGDKADIESFIRVCVKDENKIICMAEIPIKIKASVTSSLWFVPGTSSYNRWNGNLSVSNNSLTKPISGYMQIVSPDKFSGDEKIDIGYIPAGKTSVISFNSPYISRMGMYTLKYNLYIDGVAEPILFEVSTDFTMASYAKLSPEIDGIIGKDEWPSNTAMFAEDGGLFKKPTDNVILSWRGVNDLSAKVSLMWDENNLYLYSRVKDDIFYHNYEPVDSWNGDNIQFALYIDNNDGFTAYGQSGTDFHEFGLSLLADSSKAVTYRYKSQDNNIESGVCTNAKTAVIRNEENHETVYEWSMPWQDITGIEAYSPKIGDRMGFSILWNDNDGDGRKGWLEYASGIGKTKNRGLFTYLNFAK